jgi:superfamily II DNA/RNA helicase
MPIEILELTKKFMKNPAKFLLKNEEMTYENIKQYYILRDKNSNWKRRMEIGNSTWPFIKSWLQLRHNLLQNKEEAQWISRNDERKRIQWISILWRYGAIAKRHDHVGIQNRINQNSHFHWFIRSWYWRANIGFVINYDLPFNKEN